MEDFRTLRHPNGFVEIVNHQKWSAWLTSALNIIALSFGGDSVQFNQLQAAAASSATQQGVEIAVVSAKGVFLAGVRPKGVSHEWHEVKGGLGLGAVATTVLRKNHGVTRFS